MVWLTSDWHLFHDRQFIYAPRGFNSVEENNKAILERHNSLVNPNDDVYVLGDLLLGGGDSLDKGLELISKFNGNLHLVRGNHDTDKRWQAYTDLPNVVAMDNAFYLKYNGYHFYLSHYPTMTGNLEKESLKQVLINFYGHTHQQDNFYNDIPWMYHVGVDSHACYPVSIDVAIQEMKDKYNECINLL